jgi:hypothetical protein
MAARFLTTTALIVVAASLGARTPQTQSQQASQAQNDRPVFRSGVSLVRLDVQVVDASGRSIPDIRPEEMRIVEGGATRPVVLFQRVAGGSGSYVEAAE